MFLSTKLFMRRGTLRVGVAVAASRRFLPIQGMTAPFATWTCQTAQKHFFSTRVAPNTANSISLLPSVTKFDVKRMSTAEICLYLKAKKPRGYDVRLKVCIDILDLSTCF